MKLIYHESEHPCFEQHIIRAVLGDDFTLELYDATRQYSPTGSAVLTTHVGYLKNQKWYASLLESGLKLIVDHLWDSDVDTESSVQDNTLILRNPSWCWIHSCLFAHSANYHEYTRSATHKNTFLMLMNKLRPHRDRALTALAPVLDSALYSYVERGRDLPDDIRSGPLFWEYYVNPSWYNDTAFSVVVESYMRSDAYFANPEVPNYRTEVSEKIFKPLAYSHPLIVYGSEGTLRYLHREGFETFSNLWAESYDTVQNDALRFAEVTQTVLEAVNTHGTGNFDAITQEKLAHNSARFFDRALVVDRFTNEIMRDVREFLL